jgi:hypothetical protein
LVANHFNLSIFHPLWFSKFKILREDELEQNVLISPALVVVPTSKFHLTLLPERAQMQFNASGYSEAAVELLRVIGGIVKTLPHTPYTAVGFNFDCVLVAPEGAQFPEWNRSSFAAPRLRSAKGTEAEDARFGAYASFNVSGARLKANLLPVQQSAIQPGVRESDHSQTEKMHINLNYHRDIPQPADPEWVLQILDKWESTFDHACEFIRSLE